MWLCWVFVAAWAFQGLLSSCTGFSLWRLLLLHSTGSRQASFSSCSTWAQELQLISSRVLAQYLWHGGSSAPWPVEIFLDQGSNPVSPALAGRFFTTQPPRKSCTVFFNQCLFCLLIILYLLFYFLIPTPFPKGTSPLLTKLCLHLCPSRVCSNLTPKNSIMNDSLENLGICYMLHVSFCNFKNKLSPQCTFSILARNLYKLKLRYSVHTKKDNVNGQSPWFSKCNPYTSTISITWEHC